MTKGGALWLKDVKFVEKKKHLEIKYLSLTLVLTEAGLLTLEELRL